MNSAAKRLVGWPGGLIVFDVRTDAMTPLAEAGASLADRVADVAAADVISVTVLTDAQVRDVVDELADHARPVRATVPVSADLRQAVSLMLAHDMPILPCVDEAGKVQGVMTFRSIVDNLGSGDAL